MWEILGNMLHVLVEFEDPDSCIFDAVPDKDKEIYKPTFELKDETD